MIFTASEDNPVARTQKFGGPYAIGPKVLIPYIIRLEISSVRNVHIIHLMYHTLQTEV